jgi:uncharacterized membrane protein
MRVPLIDRHSNSASSDTSRLEAFSDGVIAIAITLLVLEIKVPPMEEAPPSELWRALGAKWPVYLGYVISFFTIGIMWANHHTIFRSIERTDHTLIVLNLLLLFFLATVPFPTALMADYLGHPAVRIGILVYSGWFLVTAVGFNLLWHYAASGNRLIEPLADSDTVAGITRRFRLGLPSYAVAFILAFFSTWASLVVLLGLALIYLLPYPGPGRRRE